MSHLLDQMLIDLSKETVNTNRTGYWVGDDFRGDYDIDCTFSNWVDYHKANMSLANNPCKYLTGKKNCGWLETEWQDHNLLEILWILINGFDELDIFALFPKNFFLKFAITDRGPETKTSSLLL